MFPFKFTFSQITKTNKIRRMESLKENQIHRAIEGVCVGIGLRAGLMTSNIANISFKWSKVYVSCSDLRSSYVLAIEILFSNQHGLWS